MPQPEEGIMISEIQNLKERVETLEPERDGSIIYLAKGCTRTTGAEIFGAPIAEEHFGRRDVGGKRRTRRVQ